MPALVLAASKLTQFNNAHDTLLASAARTAQTDSADFYNPNWQGAIFLLNVTVASGTGGLTLRIATTDPVSGAVFLLNTAPTAVIATGLTAYAIFPGISGGGLTQATSGGLPDSYRIRVQVGDASSYTYSVAVRYID